MMNVLLEQCMSQRTEVKQCYACMHTNLIQAATVSRKRIEFRTWNNSRLLVDWSFHKREQRLEISLYTQSNSPYM